MWLAGIFSKPKPGEQIIIVAITDSTEKEIGKAFGKDWRREHTILIDKLSQAGAKVIAFDMYFEEPTAYDGELSNAIKRAQDRRTTVIAGFRNLAEGQQPKSVRQLSNAGMRLGLLCIGKK
jgi:Predicted transmembrane sensor domain